MSIAPRRSWGLYPPHPQSAHGIDWRSETRRHLDAVVRDHGTTLPFGRGRSYGDSCLAASDHVLETRRLDRFVTADWVAGTLVAEAGLMLADVLRVAIPKGWFLPVTPGTKFVTLGGAVANDVHGKNHHVRGTFGSHVRRFGLVRSDREPMICSATDHPDMFAGTIGGLGLTGVISWVELQLMPIAASTLDSVSVRFDRLDEFFALSAELDPRHEYTVSWIDCLAQGPRRGRGIFMAANHASSGPLESQGKRPLAMPFTPPFPLLGRRRLRAFNAFYHRRHPEGRRQTVIDHDPFFYPLDRVLHWNRIYGPHGFQQYQCVIPHNDAPDAIDVLLDAIASSGKGSFLAVLKRCGDIRSPGLLSFPLPGTSLALDFAQAPDLQRLFATLDAIVREAGGRLYPAKDAHMSGADFRRFYPRWMELDTLRDPTLRSRFWNRVTSI